MKWLWLAGAVLLAAAAGATWFAFQRPDFVAGLVAVAVGAAWKALAPAILKSETPEAREKRIEAYRRGTAPATKQNPHPDERGGRR